MARRTDSKQERGAAAYRALLLDVEVSMLGLAIAWVLGVAAAIIMSQSSWLERGLYPFAILLPTVPILAIVPSRRCSPGCASPPTSR
ncbi:MAG: hypothetical protein ACR2G2_06675 [Pseudonocardia sp.]